MNLRRSFDDFNPSRFFVFFVLFLFVVLFSLRLDNFIQWSNWIVFLPLWIWKMTVIFGFLVGAIVWCRHPEYRIDNCIPFKAMILSAICQIILFIFEILACHKLETDENQWVFIFIPLLVLSISGIAICIWALKNGRSFDLELVCAVNILFFVFLALRLDNWVKWSWSIVFIPLWIVMSVVIVMELYGLILAIILCKSPELMPEQRRHTLSVTLGYACVVFPLLIFEVILVQKLDGQISVPYTVVAIPLLLALIVLLLMTFKIRAGSGNPWWFGMHKSFCQLVLEVCPLLQEYGNISYKMRAMKLIPVSTRTSSENRDNPHSNAPAVAASQRTNREPSGDTNITLSLQSTTQEKSPKEPSEKSKKLSLSLLPAHTFVIEIPD